MTRIKQVICKQVPCERQLSKKASRREHGEKHSDTDGERRRPRNSDVGQRMAGKKPRKMRRKAIESSSSSCNCQWCKVVSTAVLARVAAAQAYLRFLESLSRLDISVPHALFHIM